MEPNAIEDRLHATALEYAQAADTPDDERELAACVLALFREVRGYRALGLTPVPDGPVVAAMMEVGPDYRPRLMTHGVSE